MRFLANENFPVPSIKVLRKAGIEIKSIAEELPGISDIQVIKIAQQAGLVILTFDKDYGELIFKLNSRNPRLSFSSGLKVFHPLMQENYYFSY